MVTSCPTNSTTKICQNSKFYILSKACFTNNSCLLFNTVIFNLIKTSSNICVCNPCCTNRNSGAKPLGSTDWPLHSILSFTSWGWALMKIIHLKICLNSQDKRIGTTMITKSFYGIKSVWQITSNRQIAVLKWNVLHFITRFAVIQLNWCTLHLISFQSSLFRRLGSERVTYRQNGLS